jgi:hypothetical protein
VRFTERVKEIIELNLVNHYIPLVVQADGKQVFPMYQARIMEEDLFAVPVTAATGIDKALETTDRAVVLVADRQSGFEAYVLEGSARYVTGDDDFQLVAEMRNVVPALPIHAAVVFEVKEVRLEPPP